MSRKIEVSQNVFDELCEMTSKGETFDDSINFLINYYFENEEFNDEDAEYYNSRIEKFENGNYEGTSKVSLKDLK